MSPAPPRPTRPPIAPPKTKKPPVQGGGPLGFGCGALLAVAFVGFFWLPTSSTELIVFAVLAIVGGLLGARYGDALFMGILEKFR